jgi:transcriptional regulator with AAA-type ATPase domain/tetratricopeptide (TPR) repeat protein
MVESDHWFARRQVLVAGLFNAVDAYANKDKRRKVARVLSHSERRLETYPGCEESILQMLHDIEGLWADRGQYAHWCLLVAWAGIRSGRYDSRPLINDALHYYKTETDTEKLGRALLYKGHLYSALGRFHEAGALFRESYLIFEKMGAEMWQGRVLNRESHLFLSTGYLDKAVESLSKAIYFAEKAVDTRGGWIYKANLARLSLAAGRISKALAILAECRRAIPRGVDLFAFCGTYALCNALQGRPAVARTWMNKARSSIRGRDRESVYYYQELGRVHLLANQFDDAIRALEKGYVLAVKIAPGSALVSGLCVLLAEAFLHVHQATAAQSYVCRAMQVAGRESGVEDVAGCCRILGQIACVRSEPEAAEMWFQRAIRLFSRAQSSYECARTRLLAAQSGVFAEGDRTALAFLAQEYFLAERMRKMADECRCLLAGTGLSSGAMTPVTGPASLVEGLMIAESSIMRGIVRQAQFVASSEMCILLTGPTGCGKDVLARVIHGLSKRPGRFVAVNVTAIPESMVESELFGHQRGAFTGADHDKPGLLEDAHDGTVYLNEIGDASLALQAKLLDVIERKVIRRLGENRERKLAFRLISATNRDIESLVLSGKFREDLFFRLNEIRISMPGLSERSEDVPALVEHFLGKYHVPVGTAMERQARLRLVSLLSIRDWSGNVRQLENEIKRLILLGNRDLPHMVQMLSAQTISPKVELERILRQTNWNRREAARRLRVSEGAVRKRIKKYGLTPGGR